MVIVIGVLIFTMIIFASMVNRVRHETSITARTSLSEQLNQAASAIGRIVVRKLQRDVETYDKESNNEVVEAIMQGKEIKDIEISDDIKDLDVIKALMANFNHGSSRKMSFEAKYGVEMGTNLPGGGQFPPELTGLEGSPLEQQGFFTVKVKVSYANITKSCLIKRSFLVTRLLAPPFYRFTLFSTKGANMKSRDVNRLSKVESLSSSEIKYNDTNPPLVLFNHRIPRANPDQQGLDFRVLQKSGSAVNPGARIIKDRNTLSKNGWVFLGGSGDCKPFGKNEKSLILNVCSGSNEPVNQKFFGEYFHFFYSEASNGWVAPDKWNNWLNAKTGQSPSSPRVMVTFVDFGHMKRRGFPFNGRPLFDGTLESYKSSDGDDYENGSALHLWGTPSLCTPTLIFGRVKRRYLRTSSFLFNDVGKVYPIRSMDPTSWAAFPNEIIAYLKSAYQKKNKSWDQPFSDAISYFLANELNYQMYLSGDTEKNTLRPFFVETEPYVYGLRNIAKPEDPADPKLSWDSVFQGYEYIQEPEKLQQDYSFQNDPYLHFSGRLESIQTLPPKYLARKTSYYIYDEAPRSQTGGSSSGQSDTVYLSKCDFLIKKNVVDTSKNPIQVYLNQNIRFKGNLVIDKPMEVWKGGVIMCDGRITINAPLINPWFKRAEEIPDAFGFITLIAKNGIELNLPPTPAGTFGYPEFHGFLMCMNGGTGGIDIPNRKPVHIIGGVAVDQIDKLVEYGGIIEWGFEPEELTEGKDMGHASFIGLAMGPRDIEIISEGIEW
jgi:hypothetical protein